MFRNSAFSCDIAVIGGSLGGVAAALAACDAGASVVLTEATDWLGGQATSQGVSALDEHRYIETFGATRRYAAFREAIRDHYRRRYGIAAMPMVRRSTPATHGCRRSASSRGLAYR